MSYPADFWDWTEDKRNAYFAAEAKKHREKNANSHGHKFRVKDPKAEERPKPKAILKRLDSVAMQPIEWIWKHWLARGKLHILAGDMSTGKTTIALSIAATVTTGGVFPDGSRCNGAGNVIIWSGEDGAADTLKPRLVACGADESKIFIIDGSREGEKERAFDPATDMEGLSDAIDEIGGAALLLIDPVVSAISGDSHKNAETRRGLQPVVDLAQKHNCAALGISHFTKGTGGRNPTERVTGSLAFAAFARIVLVTAKNEADDGPARILARAKSNIGPDGGGFGYDVEHVVLESRPDIETSRVVWGDPLEGTAKELLARAEAQDAPETSKAESAKAFLTDILANGPVASDDIKNAASAKGLSWRTLQRAKGELGIKARKENSFDGGWFWSLSQDAGGVRQTAKNTKDCQHPGFGGLREKTGKNRRQHTDFYGSDEDRQGVADFDGQEDGLAGFGSGTF